MNPRCPECRIGFIDVEGRTAHRRFSDHMGVKHLFQCKECDLCFISVPHLKFHINYVHDIPCGNCGSLCEFKCPETGVVMMKFQHIKQSQAETIKNLEEEVIQESMNKSGVNMELTRLGCFYVTAILS